MGVEAVSSMQERDRTAVTSIDFDRTGKQVGAVSRIHRAGVKNPSTVSVRMTALLMLLYPASGQERDIDC